MIFVNILNSSKRAVFLRQLDRENFKDFKFCENSNEDRVWDYVVVYEEIKKPIELSVKEGGLIFFSGEPPDSRFYCKSFLRQFDKAVSTHSRLESDKHIISQTALNWHFGYSHSTGNFAYDFDALKNMPPPQKTRNISVITSSLCMMPGHLKRQRLIAALKSRYAGKIDFFGKGVKFVDDKAEAISPYRFHICLENSKVPHYWTEKFADPLLGYAVAIYFGDPIIGKYFPEKAFFEIDVNDFEGVCALLDRILENPEKIYREKLPYLIKAREKLLNEYNFFNVFTDYIKRGVFSAKDNSKRLTLLPNNAFFSGRMGMRALRLKRLLFKLYMKLFAR